MILAEGRRRFVGDEDLAPGQAFGLADRVDALEFEEISVLVRGEGLDGVFPRSVLVFQKNFKKKPWAGGGSAWSRTFNSPLRPLLRRIVPRRRTSAFLDDFEVVAALQLHARRTEDDPDGPGRSALLADDLAQVFRGHFELENRGLFAFELGDLHFFRLVHKSFRDQFDELFHG
jgi:hypothetical protein